MKKWKRVSLVVLAFLIVCLSVVFLRNQLKNSLRIFAETHGNLELTLAMQNALYHHFGELLGEYVTIHYDSIGKISGISVHASDVTLLASEMTIFLHQTLQEYQSNSFGIPIGNLTGLVMLSGRGPQLPLRPVASGHIATEMISTFESAGINQTLHKVSVHFVVAVRYLAPLETFSDTISFDIVVAETVVVGEVPIYRD